MNSTLPDIQEELNEILKEMEVLATNKNRDEVFRLSERFGNLCSYEFQTYDGEGNLISYKEDSIGWKYDTARNALRNSFQEVVGMPSFGEEQLEEARNHLTQIETYLQHNKKQNRETIIA
mgnify:CR=1 FL=1